MKERLLNSKQEYINSALSDFDKGTLHLLSFDGVKRFKSVRRAIRRGNVDLFTGIVYPRRPFNNRKPTNGRKLNEFKKCIYDRITGKLGML